MKLHVGPPDPSTEQVAIALVAEDQWEVLALMHLDGASATFHLELKRGVQLVATVCPVKE